MATRLKDNVRLVARAGLGSAFGRSLFASVGAVFLLAAVLVGGWQYRREKEYKADLLHARLQVYNLELAHTLGRDIADTTLFRRYVSKNMVAGLRVTVVSLSGRVLADSHERDLRAMGDHSRRTEISAAFAHGQGYAIKRLSASTHTTYFYSATRVGDVVVRSAVPYNAALTRSLRADHTWMWWGGGLVLLLVVVLWHIAGRVSRHIGLLRDFCAAAERGEPLDHTLERALPDDELGDISHTVIALYARLRDSERDKARLKRQLTENAAHELKTPAASVHGYLETILSHPDMEPQTRQRFLERCFAQSGRMVRLLRDMATLTRLDTVGDTAAPTATTRESLDVAALIDAALADAAPALAQTAMATVVDVPRPLTLTADRSLLYSVFRNLIDNAAAYAQGATRLTIAAERRPKDRRTGALTGGAGLQTCVNKPTAATTAAWLFTVADNGCGVSPEHLGHLFERFYRVDKGRSRAMGGTGLGLAIVRNAVAAHGGTCQASATPGGGLTVTFTLPVA